MQDLRKNKRKMINKHMNAVNNPEIEEMSDDLERVYRPKHSDNCNPCPKECEHEHEHECDCECECHHHHHHHEDCEPCEVESDNCVNNPCSEECCTPIVPSTFSTSNSIPVAIETNRVFDSIVFQTLTDGMSLQGPLVYDIEVAEVRGPVPRTGPVSVTIEKVCMNYCSIDIESEDPRLEDFNVVKTCSDDRGLCDTTFEYKVCGDTNTTCCEKKKGQSVAYKQKGLVATVKDLVLELRGKCGCTEIIALAYPAVRTPSGCLQRVSEVQFSYNTFAASCCLPASGRPVTLRQDYQVSLTVDCVGKAYLCLVEVSDCECYYNLDIPNGIDVVLCLQEVVSILVNERIVVLASPTQVSPRVVDNYSKLCDFTQCVDSVTSTQSGESTTSTNGCNTCKKTYK
ncbi:Uncharacterised protein [uncultured Clostridium sp.]|nr:Uncharacterised protein [uncultured Clostridium sp.]